MKWLFYVNVRDEVYAFKPSTYRKFLEASQQDPTLRASYASQEGSKLSPERSRILLDDAFTRVVDIYDLDLSLIADELHYLDHGH